MSPMKRGAFVTVAAGAGGLANVVSAGQESAGDRLQDTVVRNCPCPWTDVLENVFVNCRVVRDKTFPKLQQAVPAVISKRRAPALQSPAQVGNPV